MKRVGRRVGIVLVLGAWACEAPGTTAREAPVTANDGAHVPAAPSGISPRAPDDAWIVSGARDLDGHTLELAVSGNRLVATGSVGRARRVELPGYYLTPAFIDSHVHLSYYPVADALPAGGVVAAVDFAAPIEALREALPIPVLRSGPMLTPPGGYPTRSWGSGGYGLEVATPVAAEDAVDQLLAAGARFIKSPLAGSDGVDDATLAAIVARAHERGARVAVHALGAADAARAIASSIDVLAHTPVDPLAPEQFTAFAGRTLVSTLAAFGSGSAAAANLRGFAAAGTRILYGTDLGNTRQIGIQSDEIRALVQAGLDAKAIVRAATADAADFWGFDELGRLQPGKRASFLVLSEDPELHPEVLATPHAVVFDGKIVSGALP